MLIKRYFTNFLGKAGVQINGDQPADIRVNDERLFKKMFLEPTLGAGEGYMKGWWDCERLDEFFNKLCRSNLDSKLYRKWLLAVLGVVNKLVNLQTKFRSKQVAEQHYNLGNDLYRHMLGETMAYTCAYWKDAQTLDEAQRAKFELICRKIHLKPGERVLDLGCGWGTLTKYMAEKYGCEVVAVNISEEQVKYAREINKDLPVTICLNDYRDDHLYNPTKKPFDKVVSVGLCEHVGYKNYRGFMEVALRNMKEHGLFLLHTIGKNESGAYVNPWIHKYIFPNGILPSVKLIGEAAENLFIIEDLHNFGSDYDKTLMAWHKNFNDNWHLYKDEYGETFFRMWNYYLLSCAGAFRARGLQLWQFVLSPKGIEGGYESVR